MSGFLHSGGRASAPGRAAPGHGASRPVPARAFPGGAARPCPASPAPADRPRGPRHSPHVTPRRLPASLAWPLAGGTPAPRRGGDGAFAALRPHGPSGLLRPGPVAPCGGDGPISEQRALGPLAPAAAQELGPPGTPGVHAPWVPGDTHSATWTRPVPHPSSLRRFSSPRGDVVRDKPVPPGVALHPSPLPDRVRVCVCLCMCVWL